jgi:uncharacterized membrane protein
MHGATLEHNRGAQPRPMGWWVIALASCGMLNAGALVREHVLFHVDPAYRSFCDFTESFTCRGVALSPWSVVAGIPVAVWGLIGLVPVMAVAAGLVRARGRAPAALVGWLLLLAAGAVAVSSGLILISTFLIGALCPLCTLSHVVNAGIAGASFIAARRAGGVKFVLVAAALAARDQPRAIASVAAIPAAIAVTVGLLLPPYWKVGAIPAAAGPMCTGTTPEGAPWIGAQEPELTIVEFSDYQCPHCRRAHHEVRTAVAAAPERLRLVHCQYPLDHHCNEAVVRPMHEQACDMACLAFCAGEQGRFWDANDYLFGCENPQELTPFAFACDLQLDACALQSCLSSSRPRDALRQDLRQAAALGVKSTPSFAVAGNLYVGRVPEGVLVRSQDPPKTATP